MRAAVVGGGHNGLVAACYLARAGVDVVVLEQADTLGGGSRTAELVPGFRFDLHSVAHNIINATDIGTELRLREAGLVYREMDPFSVAVLAGGPIIRFHRSVERTVASIAEVDPAEARRYADWMHAALPVITALRAGLPGDPLPRRLRRLPGVVPAAARALGRNGGPLELLRLVLSPYGRMLRERLDSELVRAPVAAFAAHASAGPDDPGGALFGLWQAFYHQVGQWHPVGGAQALVDALRRRLESFGGRWRTGARVARITHGSGGVTGVELASGERLAVDGVVTAIDPRVALLTLLDPPLAAPLARALRAAHRGNAVQLPVFVAADALPRYPGARPGDWSGLQSFVDSLDALAAGFAQARAGHLPDDPVPTYAFTPSALDGTLAPPGRHTVYLACPAVPFRLRGGWDRALAGFAERMIDTVEARAPGFRDAILARRLRSPERMARELDWPGAHPMHLDPTLDQLGPLRPVPALGGHRTPVPGLVISGAGTAPVGGVAGIPGRAAAHALLRAHGRSRMGKRERWHRMPPDRAG
ncbi:Phytoene dehydrogenase-related protein [Amycolatopsis arida]|uniref:Pyridine nucleotide-disulfide oxidoreductase domain-containing protein 2 n=1 Tax=Amycolatopsis arida TaxID=587909 RepID=A0A1I5ZBN2_9PSEU|nr:NAD(P)/FAD-dependent oxidoreductase [Amycolatopsis arida]TDX89492.1 phytoene dehydrogenase-like protein [Amycolatopsis arida]SFQ53825.1 Phytoene dehydrogenase-related protein [Amycolatopsis arida]